MQIYCIKVNAFSKPVNFLQSITLWSYCLQVIFPEKKISTFPMCHEHSINTIFRTYALVKKIKYFYGRVYDRLLLLFSQQAIDATTIKDVCTRYIFNKAPAIAAVGMLHFWFFFPMTPGAQLSIKWNYMQIWILIILARMSTLAINLICM